MKFVSKHWFATFLAFTVIQGYLLSAASPYAPHLFLAFAVAAATTKSSKGLLPKLLVGAFILDVISMHSFGLYLIVTALTVFGIRLLLSSGISVSTVVGKIAVISLAMGIFYGSLALSVLAAAGLTPIGWSMIAGISLQYISTLVLGYLLIKHLQ